MKQNKKGNEKKADESIDLEIQEFVNADWNDKQSLLHIAVSENNMKLVKQCFRFGIDVNKVDDYGRTALFYCNNLDIAKLLVDQGIDVNILNRSGETAVVDLYPHRNDEVFTYLVSITDLDLVDGSSSPNTLLEKMILCDEQDFSLIQMVVNRTKDINRINTYGNSYLISASQNKKYKDVILLLIDAGFNLYARNRFGNNFYDLSFKYVQAEIKMRYPEFMKRKDMTDNQRQRLEKLSYLKSLEMNGDCISTS